MVAADSCTTSTGVTMTVPAAPIANLDSTDDTICAGSVLLRRMMFQVRHIHLD